MKIPIVLNKLRLIKHYYQISLKANIIFKVPFNIMNNEYISKHLKHYSCSFTKKTTFA